MISRAEVQIKADLYRSAFFDVLPVLSGWGVKFHLYDLPFAIKVYNFVVSDAEEWCNPENHGNMA